MTPEIQLGDVARDTITGYTGVVIGITKWLHGCKRYTLQAQALNKDGKPMEAGSFDLPQLELVSSKAAATTSGGGGPQPEPERGR